MSTECRFYCPELQREVSTEECYDRGDSGRACYGELCDYVERAVCLLAQARLQACYGDQISMAWNETDGTLTIRFHEHLTLEAYYDRLFRTIGFDAYLGITHGHDFPAEDADGLVRIVGELLQGEKAFVVSGGWFGGVFQMVDRDELLRMWRRYTWGWKTRIVDGRDVYSKQEYLTAHQGRG